MYKPIPDFPDYLVSQRGDIVSTKPHNNKQNKTSLIKPHKIKKFIWNKYNAVALHVNKKQIKKKIAWCVLTALVSSRPKGYQILHGIKGRLVDTLDNLSWGTPEQNMKDKERDGTDPIGENNPSAKLSDKDIKFIRENYSFFGKNGLTQTNLAKKFSVSQASIWRIVKNKTWKHIK